MQKDKNKTNETPIRNAEEDLAAELLLKETDEAMRQEKLEAIWREWGGTLIIAMLMIVFGTMIGVGWQTWQTNYQQGQTDALVNFSRADTYAPAALDSLGLHGSYQSIAFLQAYHNTDDPAERLRLAEQAAASDLPAPYDVIADWIVLREKAAADEADKASLSKAMQNLGEESEESYGAMIMLEAAHLAAQSGDTGKAAAILKTAMTMPQAESNADLKDTITGFYQLYTAQTQDKKS